jgi:hypothetical protein
MIEETMIRNKAVVATCIRLGESGNTGHGRTEVAVNPYPTTTANNIMCYPAFIH